jgi:hypothetical protein
MDKGLATWLEELEKEFVFAPEHTGNQAVENMHSFSWNDERRKEIPSPDFASFIEGCCKIVAQKTSEPATFYAWVDTQAGQLRFSVISGKSDKLPFGCKVVLSSLEKVAESIALMEGFTSSGDLNVWVREMYRGNLSDPSSNIARMTPKRKRHFRILWRGALYILGGMLLTLYVLSLLFGKPTDTLDVFLLIPLLIGYMLGWNALGDILAYLLIAIGLMAYGLFVLKKHACLLFWMGFSLFCLCAWNGSYHIYAALS